MQISTLLKYFTILGYLNLLFSCEPPSEIGADLFIGQSFDLFPIDSFTLKFSTVKSDSFNTEAPSRLLVGYHRDGTFGSIQASPYFQVGLDSFFTVDEKTTHFDSLTMFIAFDGYYYFDTTKQIQLTLHQIEEEFENEDGFFNTSTLSYNPVPLSTYTLNPKPNRGEALEFKLPERLGMELYAALANNDELISVETKFLDRFKGFVILPDTTISNCFLGLSPLSIQMRLYYTDKSELPTKQFFKTFSAGTSGEITLNYFNNITTDYMTTDLASFNDSKTEELTADFTDDYVFLQGGAGLSINVEFPSIKSLLEADENFILSRASLRFAPVKDLITEASNLQAVLITRVLDKDNDFLVGNSTNAILSFDEEFGRDTYYEIDVTDFVKSEVYNEAIDINALSFNAQFENSSVDRIIIDTDGDIKPTLTIYLLKIK